MLKKIFFAAVIAVLSGCCCTKNNTPATESDANETFEIGGRVVEAVISGNFSDFAAAAGENSSEKTAKEFSESRKELIRNYGELCSFRRFGTLQTPLFVNIFYAYRCGKESIKPFVWRIYPPFLNRYFGLFRACYSGYFRKHAPPYTRLLQPYSKSGYKALTARK